MKKFYTMMVMAVIALLSFEASAYSITLKFDNPAAIGSIIQYSDYNKEVIQDQYTPASEVVVNYDDNSKILDVVAADGYALGSCVFTTSTSTNSYFQNSYKGNHDIYLSSGYSGATYTYTTVDMDAARSNTATVTVNGDVSKVALQFSGTWLYANLVQGENIVKFMDSESTFAIGPKSYGQSLYSVKLNGVEQATTSIYSTNWSLTVKDGDVIVINADFPEVPCEVSFVFAEDGTEDYVTAVYLNQQPVADWQNGFTANGGDNLYFTVNSNLYKLNDFQVNGETKNLNGSYTTSVDGNELEFYFDVEAYGMCVAHVTVDNPERLQYRVGYSGSYQDLPGASFDVEISEAIASYTPVYFMVNADNLYISSMVAGEYTISKNYDGSFSTNITDGMNITITTGEIVRDKTAYFYFHNPDAATDYNKALYGYYFSNACTSGIDLQAGYNVLTFGDVDNPYKFQVNGNLENVEPMVWFYYNGELTTHTDQYNTIWEMAFNNNDVIKVYIGSSEPENKVVTINMPQYEAGKGPIFIVDYVNEELPVQTARDASADYSFTALPGTHVTIKPNGNTLSVSVDDEDVEADEDGNYCFSVGDTNPSVKIIDNGSTGIENITIGTNAADGRIFNLQGIEMKSDNLPAGLYIIGGRKVLVR